MLRRFRVGTLEKITIVFGCDVDIVSRELECNGITVDIVLLMHKNNIYLKDGAIYNY